MYFVPDLVYFVGVVGNPLLLQVFGLLVLFVVVLAARDAFLQRSA